MKVSVCQSNYIPWKGYFDLIHRADVFVVYDCVQYTKNDWRNRNIVKTPHGAQWLTVPVVGGLGQRICDVAIARGNWASKHWKTLRQNYAKATHWERYAEGLEAIYRASWTNLSALNLALLRFVCEALGIGTRIVDSREFTLTGEREARLLDLLRQCVATSYVSGPAAKAYIDEQSFGIPVEWMRYEYPEYAQLYPPFDHRVSVLDLLFHAGPDAPRYIWG